LPQIDWCFYLSQARKSFTDQFTIALIKKFLPKVTRRCPPFGQYKIVNVKLEKQYFSIYPDGIFRYDIKLSDGNDFASGSLFMEVEN
jgi:hypothetical protein